MQSNKEKPTQKPLEVQGSVRELFSPHEAPPKKNLCQTCTWFGGFRVMYADLVTDNVSNRLLTILLLLVPFMVIFFLIAVPILSANISYSLTYERVSALRMVIPVISSVKFGKSMN